MRRFLRTALTALALCGAAAAVPARAGEIRVFEPNAHSLTGELAAAEEHYVPMDLPAGTLLTFQFRRNKKADKNSAFVPDAELVGPDGSTVSIPSALLNAKKGFDVKKLPIATTGRHVLILRGLGGSSGPYALKVKAKYPKKLQGVLDGVTVLDGAEGPLEIPFAAKPGTKVGATVSGSKGGAVPDLPRVRQPNGNAFGPPQQKGKKTGFTFKNFEQRGGEFGTYAVTFSIDPETAAGERSFKYKVSFKFPKAPKAKLVYGDLVIEPLVTSISPNDVPVSVSVVQLQVTGRFFQPAARLFLKMAGEPDWVPEGQTATSAGITAPIVTLGRSPGLWDVVAANPSGGQRVSSRALLVRPPTPMVTGVEPGFTVDDRTEATVTLTGTQLARTTTFTFERDLPGGGREVIVPTNVQTAPTGAGVAVTISPLRRPLGLYDVTAVNPGPTPDVPGSNATTATGVFEIRNAPPRIAASTPDRNLSGGDFQMTIDGAEFEAGAQVVLRRPAQGDVRGRFVRINGAGTQITVTFDMDGKALGSWSLVVENPDTQQATRTDAFSVPSLSTSASLTNNVLGEPAMDLAAEHDLGLAVWLESDEGGTGGTSWKVMGRVFDSFLNTWAGNAFPVSTASKNAASKRYVTVSYNPDVDQWLVVWTEHTFAGSVNERTRAGLTPTSGTIYQIYGRRVNTSGGLVGSEIDFIDSSASATGGGQVYDTFEYFNPQVVYAPWDGNWYLTFSQQWDSISVVNPGQSTEYVNDDWDVFVWRLDKNDPRLDPNFHRVVHRTENHEGDCLAAVDADRDQLFIVGSCDSRGIGALNPREIEAKWSTTSRIEPGIGGSNASPSGVLQLTSRATGEVENFTNPRPAYNTTAAEYVTVYERIDEGGSGKKEIRAARVDAVGRSVVGSEIVIATDASNDLILPRVVYNADADEYLVTWTVDDAGGTPRARGQRLSGATAAKVGAVLDFGSAGSGLGYVVVDEERGSYTRVFVSGFGAFGANRFGTSLTLELFE